MEPPEKPEGGFTWYNIRATKYRCPMSYMFESGNQYEYSTCTVVKTWAPDVLMDCVRKYSMRNNFNSFPYFSTFINISARECPKNPPDYHMTQEMDWPLKSRQLGTEVTYTCPIFSATWKDYLEGIERN